MNLVKVKDTVRYSFQIIQHITAINTVTVTHTDMQGSTFTRPVIEIGIDGPVELFPCKVITQFGYDAEPLVASENPVVTEILPL